MILSIAIALVAIIITIFFVADDAYGKALLPLAIGGVAIAFFSPDRLLVWPWILSHIGSIIVYLLIYAAIGGIWSIVKWYLVLKELQRKGYTRSQVKNLDYSDTYVTWATYWPLVLLITLFRNPFNYVVRQLSQVYNRIFDSVYGKEETVKNG